MPKLGGSNGAGSNHNLLSSTHPDATAATVLRGSIVVGVGATPKWEAVPLGTTGKLLISDGTDLLYRVLVAGDIPAHGKTQHTGAVIVGANENLGAYYLDAGEIAVPADPGANVRRIFVDSATGKLSVRTSAGATVSLEETGGSGAFASASGSIDKSTTGDVVSLTGTTVNEVQFTIQRGEDTTKTADIFKIVSKDGATELFVVQAKGFLEIGGGDSNSAALYFGTGGDMSFRRSNAILNLHDAGGVARMQFSMGETHQHFKVPTSGQALMLSGNETDGATNFGIILNNQQTFSTAGSKLLSVQNNGTEKMSVGYDGAVTALSFNPTTKQTYAPTNDLTDRAFDADTVAVAELADVVATLIRDLAAAGLVTV